MHNFTIHRTTKERGQPGWNLSEFVETKENEIYWAGSKKKY